MPKNISLVASYLTLILGAAAVIGGLPVYVTPCSKTTCEPLTPDSALPSGPIGLSSVTAISDSTECPGTCSDIDTAAGDIHVVGNYYDLWCKVWGGSKCSFNGAK